MDALVALSYSRLIGNHTYMSKKTMEDIVLGGSKTGEFVLEWAQLSNQHAMAVQVLRLLIEGARTIQLGTVQHTLTAIDFSIGDIFTVVRMQLIFVTSAANVF